MSRAEKRRGLKSRNTARRAEKSRVNMGKNVNCASEDVDSIHQFT